jgi:hypothetical protein
MANDIAVPELADWLLASTPSTSKRLVQHVMPSPMR